MAEAESLFEVYIEEIIKWNSRVNLVSRNDIPFLKERHLQDSLAAASKISGKSIVADIGSGNGFPVIPLSIAKPDCQFHAFESREKRTIFLDHVCRKCGIKNLKVHNVRVEKEMGEFSKFADIVISRAFKENVQFVESALSLLKKEGQVITFNTLLNNEIEEIEKKHKVKVKNVDNYVYNLDNGQKRTLSSFIIS
ncbi:MAG: 16S rRNA (guanine(527)-N(7))-methyltransferase RsmG [Fibrobacteres bacterium]|nr:16S rRNA (guanine(527)-N(7))-methyltransferase RsmG [Fibrobacterota bacterium]